MVDEGFEWDEAKSAWTERERGFDFDYARRVFDGPHRTTEDARRPYGETRHRTMGEVDGVALVVVWTPRPGGASGGDRRRIISARPASRRERREDHDDRALHG